jgi:hypothetical protein
MKNYGTTYAPGYFGHKTKILCVHKTAALAEREASRHRYTDETGTRRYPLNAVHSPQGFSRGETVWSDRYPDLATDPVAPTAPQEVRHD